MAYINIGCYYLFGLPLGYLLGYVAELGVKVMYSLFIILFIFVSKNFINFVKHKLFRFGSAKTRNKGKY